MLRSLFDALKFDINDRRWYALVALLVGLLIYAVIRIIPFLAFVVIILGLGAIAGAIWMRDPEKPKRARRTRK
jgi:hypothetical protein